jgi:hypothetical protein
MFKFIALALGASAVTAMPAPLSFEDAVVSLSTRSLLRSARTGLTEPPL